MTQRFRHFLEEQKKSLDDFPPKFPFEKWFASGKSYLYPHKYTKNKDLSSVIFDGEVKRIVIKKDDFRKWTVIDVKKIPKDVVSKMMKEFE